MTIVSSPASGGTLVLRLSGRLDAPGSEILENRLQAELRPGVANLILDLADVSYLSSVGLRVFIKAYKALSASGGALHLAGVGGYCANVLEIAGFGSAFARHTDVPTALRAAAGPALPAPRDWTQAESLEVPEGRLRILPGQSGDGFIDIVGHIEDVLAARVTPAHIRSKKFSQKAYSIGLGALGARVDEYLHLMGEMITIGGTMVWLPTDGYDKPDFLIPKQDSDTIMLRTGFNASLAGPFHDYVEFRSASPEGVTMAQLYRIFFDQAKKRRPEYRGAIGLALCGTMGVLYGSGVTKAPVAGQAPANGKWITDPSNFAEWFEVDKTPRHAGVTVLVAGVGVDLTCDTGVFSQEPFKATFYVNPANVGGKAELLHNHAVAFKPLPLPEDRFSLEGEVASTVENGEFVDMRHLLDNSTITRAVAGLVYVKDFRPDTGWEPSA
jgi:anti-anti-sigma factor